MDGIREQESIYGGSEYTERTGDEYRCNACNTLFTLTGDTCPECGSTDWEFSPGGVGFQ